MVGDVLEIEDIFYESESERDEYGEEHSFSYRVQERERARDHAEVLARLFHEADDYIVEQHQLHRSEYGSPDRHASAGKRGLQYAEREECAMEEGKEDSYDEDYRSIPQIGACGFPDIPGEEPDGGNEYDQRDESDSGKERNRERNHVACDEKRKDTSVREPEIRKQLAHVEHRNDRYRSRQDPDPEPPSPERGIVQVRKHIPPEKYREEGDYGNRNDGQESHRKAIGLFSENLVLPELDTLPFSVFEYRGSEEHIGSDDDEDDPYDVRDEFRRRYDEDSGEDENDADEIHGVT